MMSQSTMVRLFDKSDYDKFEKFSKNQRNIELA